MSTFVGGDGSLGRRVRLAVKHVAYSGWRRDRWQRPDQVVATLGLRPGDRVVDLGAGTGYFTFRLAGAVGPDGRVYAVDTDDDLRAMIETQARRGGYDNVQAVAAQPRDLSLPEPVDLVFLTNAFHHIPEPGRYFNRVARHLRPGGRLAVIESRVQGLHRVFGHATSPEDICATLEPAGYRLLAEHGFLPRQSFLVFEHATGVRRPT